MKVVCHKCHVNFSEKVDVYSVILGITFFIAFVNALAVISSVTGLTEITLSLLPLGADTNAFSVSIQSLYSSTSAPVCN